MSENEYTKKIVVDVNTGFAYGLKFDSADQCVAMLPLNHVIETLDGLVVHGPGMTDSEDDYDATKAELLPFGKTLYAIEVNKDAKNSDVYTIVVPKKADAIKGAKPQVTSKKLAKDLVKAGFAAAPKASNAKDAKKSLGSDEELAKALENIDKMIGLENAKRDIRQNIALARFNRMKEEMGLSTKPISRHMVFTGNPGTGKTTFAREVAKVYHALGFIERPDVVEVKREDLVAGYVGQTAIKTQDVIKKAKGGVLFIDEAYALSRDAGSDSKDFGREAIDTLVAAMENLREDLIVIVAGYTEPMKRFIDANEGLKSRFTTYIDFQDYSIQDLSSILDFMLKERGYTIEAPARDHLVKIITDEKSTAKKDFGNARSVRNLVEKAEKELALRLEKENKLGQSHGLTEDDLRKVLTTITFADVENVSLKAIAGKKAAGMSFNAATAAPVKSLNDNNAPPVAASVDERQPKNRNRSRGFKFGK